MIEPLINSKNRIELRNFKLNKAGYSISIVLMSIMAISPFLIITLLIMNGVKPALGQLFIFGVFGLSAYFFYRLATWNKFGCEYFELSDDKLIYRPKAKNISYKIIEFQIEVLEVSVVKTSDTVFYNGVKENLGWLILDDGVNKINTTIKSPISILDQLIQNFEKWNIKNNSFLNELKEL